MLYKSYLDCASHESHGFVRIPRLSVLQGLAGDIIFVSAWGRARDDGAIE
jgi:hypothetical protein